ncbi:hypothetical protein TNCV_946871 [Trichonephila clavipes]|nr:hypothetical protein TNCV_946871 [Trichonephila clavipes]
MAASNLHEISLKPLFFLIRIRCQISSRTLFTTEKSMVEDLVLVGLVSKFLRSPYLDENPVVRTVDIHVGATVAWVSHVIDIEVATPLTSIEYQTKHQNKTAWITPVPQSTIAGHTCSHPRVPRAHQAGFSRRSLAGVGLSESVRCHGPGLALLTNGNRGVQQQQQHQQVTRTISGLSPHSSLTYTLYQRDDFLVRFEE